jgi:hypothetical protein
MPLVLAALAAPLLVVLAVEARRAVGAVAARAARRSDCPFEDDDDTPRPLLVELFAVVRESVAVAWLALRGAAGAPAMAPADAAAGGRPIVVVVPERGFGAGSLLPLGRRVAAALGGRVAAAPRARDRGLAARVERLGDYLDALAAAADVVVVGHGEGGVVACRAVAARARPWVRRVVTLATAHEGADTAGAAAHAAVVSVYSLHDARLVPPAVAYLPDGINIVIRDAGHCGLVVASRTSRLVVEALADDASPRLTA